MNRVARWAKAWSDLYDARLSREEHDRRRDEMFAWADARGPEEAVACRSGQIASNPDVCAMDTVDIPFHNSSRELSR